jgi:Nitrile hydratase beta subunit
VLTKIVVVIPGRPRSEPAKGGRYVYDRRHRPGRQRYDRMSTFVDIPRRLGWLRQGRDRQVNGAHDLGGTQSFGPIPRSLNEPVFHDPWQGRVQAMTMALLVAGHFGGGGALRYAIESLPPLRYLQDGYFDRHLDGLEAALVQRKLLHPAEIRDRVAQLGGGGKPPAAARPSRPARRECRRRVVNRVTDARTTVRDGSGWATRSLRAIFIPVVTPGCPATCAAAGAESRRFIRRPSFLTPTHTAWAKTPNTSTP